MGGFEDRESAVEAIVKTFLLRAFVALVLFYALICAAAFVMLMWVMLTHGVPKPVAQDELYAIGFDAWVFKVIAIPAAALAVWLAVKIVKKQAQT